MDLAQIGGEIHAWRIQAGLLQEHVAKLTGLSRVTINQLENGTLKDLGYTKLKAVVALFGVDVQTVPARTKADALTVVARSVSTSHRDVVTPALLASILRSGDAPERFHAHVMVLLDETPLPLVVRAVAEAATPQVPAKKIMKHLRHWAEQWKSCRTVW